MTNLTPLKDGDYVKNITRDQYDLLKKISKNKDEDRMSDFIELDRETKNYYPHSYVFSARNMLIKHGFKSSCIEELSFEEFYARAVFTYSKQAMKKTKYLFNN